MSGTTWTITVQDMYGKHYVRTYDSFAALFTEDSRAAWRFATQDAAKLVGDLIWKRYPSFLIDVEERPRYA